MLEARRSWNRRAVDPEVMSDRDYSTAELIGVLGGGSTAIAERAAVTLPTSVALCWSTSESRRRMCAAPSYAGPCARRPRQCPTSREG